MLRNGRARTTIRGDRESASNVRRGIIRAPLLCQASDGWQLRPSRALRRPPQSPAGASGSPSSARIAQAPWNRDGRACCRFRMATGHLRGPRTPTVRDGIDLTVWSRPTTPQSGDQSIPRDINRVRAQCRSCQTLGDDVPRAIEFIAHTAKPEHRPVVRDLLRGVAANSRSTARSIPIVGANRRNICFTRTGCSRPGREHGATRRVRTPATFARAIAVRG